MEEKDFTTEDFTEPLASEESEETSSYAEADPEEPLDALSENLLSVEEDAFDDATSDFMQSNPLPRKVNDGIIIKKSYLIIGAAVVLALVIGGFFLGYFVNRGGDAPMPEQEIVYLPADPMKPDPNAKPYGDVQAFPEKPTPGNIIMPGYSELRMHADTNLLKSVWINSEGNSCYLRFTLRISDTGETLYQSGLIAPGMAVEESVLTRAWSRGEYKVEVLIEAFTLTEDPAPLNSMKVMSVALYVL